MPTGNPFGQLFSADAGVPREAASTPCSKASLFILVKTPIQHKIMVISLFFGEV